MPRTDKDYTHIKTYVVKEKLDKAFYKTSIQVYELIYPGKEMIIIVVDTLGEKMKAEQVVDETDNKGIPIKIFWSGDEEVTKHLSGDYSVVS